MAKKKTKKKKGGKGKRKGGKFEREICKRLSLWWSDGEDDSIFWRTHSSGGRATQRAKKGKKTTGQDGDVGAIHPSGKPLIDLVSIELKCGYNKTADLHGLIDKLDSSAPTQYEMWIDQAIRSHQNAGSFSWLIIHQRTRKEPLVIVPQKLMVELFKMRCGFMVPTASMNVGIRNREKGIEFESPLTLHVTTLEQFLRRVDPWGLRILHKETKAQCQTKRRKRS